MLKFKITYFIILLAMYYNGYIIICLLAGAFLGAFIFSWDAIGPSKAQTKTRPCTADDIPVTDRKDKQAVMFSVRWRPQMAGMPSSHPVDHDQALAIE
jgi:hypothetical protein